MKEYKMNLKKCFKPIEKDNNRTKDLTGYLKGKNYFYS